MARLGWTMDKYRKMTIFNLQTNKFEVYKNQARFLAIQIDREDSEWKEIIHIFDVDDIVPLCNEDNSDVEKSLELFSNEDVKFACYLDFYRQDNTESLIELLKNTK